MPQYELTDLGPQRIARRVRARDPEAAVRTALDLDPEAPVELGEGPDVEGWYPVLLDGALHGRVRAHNRMQFRRD